MNIQERFLVEDNGSQHYNHEPEKIETVTEQQVMLDFNYEKVYIVVGAILVALCIGFKFMVAYSSRVLSQQLPEAEKKLQRAVLKIEQIQAEKLLNSQQIKARKRRLTILQDLNGRDHACLNPGDLFAEALKDFPKED